MKTIEHSELHAQKGFQNLQELVSAHRTAAGCLPTVVHFMQMGSPLSGQNRTPGPHPCKDFLLGCLSSSASQEGWGWRIGSPGTGEEVLLSEEAVGWGSLEPRESELLPCWWGHQAQLLEEGLLC